MKIGIISCDGWLRLWDNYGTLFQNYALQKHLKRQGHETFWILRKGEKRSLKRLLFRAIFQPRAFLSRLKFFLVTKIFCRKDRKTIAAFNARHPRRFNAFFEKYVPHTDKLFSESELVKNPPSADAYIVGSDQVWGSVNTQTFLGFGASDARRIAYAVSTSWKNRNKEWSLRASEAISRFDAVSVREPEGVEVCSAVGRPDAVHVCDPTLLLEKEDYLSLVRAENSNSPFLKKTILAYFLNVKKLSDLPWTSVVEFAREREADLKVVPLQGAELAVPEEFVYAPTPTEWLNAYDKADCILTNSFHGTAFAIIMRKPFLVVLQKGKTEGENCRFFSILKKLGLESRILQKGRTIEEQMSCPIDWNEVTEKLDTFRSFSRTFLEKSLKNNS